MCENDVKRVKRSLNSFNCYSCPKGQKYYLWLFTQHCIQSNVTHLTHVEWVERSLNSFNCYSCYSCQKGQKYYLWLSHNTVYRVMLLILLMSKGSKEALTFLIVTYVSHVERVESGVCGLSTQYRYIQCYVERVKRLCYVETRDKQCRQKVEVSAFQNFLQIENWLNIKKVMSKNVVIFQHE